MYMVSDIPILQVDNCCEIILDFISRHNINVLKANILM